jgi:hypothetical protein
LQRVETRPGGILKPKWYVKTARLYDTEAEYFSRADAIYSRKAPAKTSIEIKTPHHIFVRSDSEGLVSYVHTMRQPLLKSAHGVGLSRNGISPK